MGLIVLPNPGPIRCPACGRMVTDRHFYRSGATRCRSARFCWDQARLLKLAALMEAGKTDAEIAVELETTAAAVHLAVRRHGIPPRRRLGLTARGVADRLGIGCPKTVVRWMRQGWLFGRRSYRQGPHRTWRTTDAALFAFMEDPAHWHRWDPARIPNPSLRAWATEIRQGVRFLTQTEVAHLCWVQQATVRQWIDKGWLPAVRNGNHLVREADALRFRNARLAGRVRP